MERVDLFSRRHDPDRIPEDADPCLRRVAKQLERSTATSVFRRLVDNLESTISVPEIAGIVQPGVALIHKRKDPVKNYVYGVMKRIRDTVKATCRGKFELASIPGKGYSLRRV